MQEQIEITVLFPDEKEMDLVIPTQVSLKELKYILEETFKEMGVFIDYPWHLVLGNNRFGLFQEDVISDYAIGNGSLFQIIDGEV